MEDYLSYNNDFNKMHKDAQFWYSALYAYKKDLKFTKKLLDANIFKEQVPNLFEKISQWNSKLLELEKKVQEFSSKITKHEQEMQGLVECDEISCDITYENRHREIETLFRKNFLSLQAEKHKLTDFIESVLQEQDNSFED